LKTTATATSIIARGVAALALALLAAFALTGGVMAHAEPARANPPMNGSVATAPALVEIWFSEEATEATTIKVFAPDGVRVDFGDTKLDLQDPQRVHVTVDVLKNLAAGTYRVEWNSVSGTDGDAANGQYNFTIGAGTPAASSPVASPATSVAAVNLTPEPTTTAVPDQYKTNAVDDKVLSLGIGAGVLVAIAIYLFWRWRRPKNPVV
jgi:methionine-rich copper-binding protein CopC